MIDLNVTALVHLTYAALPAFIKRGGGAIVNVASIVGIAPELLNGVYGGPKAFVLAFSRALHKEFADGHTVFRSFCRVQPQQISGKLPEPLSIEFPQKWS